MTSITNEVSSDAAIKANKRAIDRNVRMLVQEMEHDNSLVAETPTSKLQRVLKMYRQIKPLLSLVATLPLIPSTWRAALVMFNQALEALSLSGAEVSAEFKAGKDL